MFGYIQPLKCELKVREYDYYRSAYCGLCNSLKNRCGFKARFIVNYDFVFIALLLSCSENEEESVIKRRCIACPSGRQCIHSSVYDKVADISIILTYLKLCDDVTDNGFFSGLFRARIPRLLLTGAYRRAKKALPGYDRCATELYNRLCKLEAARSASLDETADAFAQMISAIVSTDGSNSRILKEIFYHIGRFVYIIDALDDYESDMKKKEYNPIAERFEVFEKSLPKEVCDRVVLTLEDSRSAVLRAFDLMPENKRNSLLKNIIELGMQNSVYRVTEKEKNKK